MSDSEDPESKTEEATEKKVSDTLAQGRTPVSREISVAFGVVALLICVAFLIDAAGPDLVETLVLLVANAGSLRLGKDADLYRYLEIVGVEIGRFLTPFLVVIAASGIVAAFIQGAPRVVFDRIAPDASRISFRAGASRIFGTAAFVELAKSCMKIAAVGTAAAIVVESDRSAYVDAMRMEPSGLPALIFRLMIHLTSVVAISSAILAGADLIWTRRKWRRDLRMSRQELKEEFKQAEGDPFIKARMRSLAADRSRRRMIAAVPKASFVIANPTHYAIALRYVREEGGAPLVVAKGKDLVALKIREVAEREGVPVLERKELARAMFDFVEVDKMIPQEFYRPVAELIHFLDRLSARRRH